MAKTATSKKPAGTVLSLKVTLRDTKPPIWRRLLMPDSMTLGDLHRAIQVTMGWTGSHLHQFEAGGRDYGDPDDTDDVANERRVKLRGLVVMGVTRFSYTYDFGDNWEHAIVVEKSPPAAGASAYPACVAGKRNGPPEDCSGAGGYARLLKALDDPADPRHDEMLEWLGGAFDAEAFSVADANAGLAAAFGGAASRRKAPA